MTPSKQAKDAGLKSLKQVSEMTGKPVTTLHNWHKDSPQLFRIVLIGCAALDEREEDFPELNNR